MTSKTASATHNFSLLYPPGVSAPARPTTNLSVETDLGLAAVIRALDPDGRHSRFIGSVLAELTTQPQVIAYRQDVLEDLLASPGLVQRLSGMMPALAELVTIGRNRRWSEQIPLPQVGGRLAELEVYLNCVEGLWTAFEETGLHSEGMQALKSLVAARRAEPQYRQMLAELPGLRSQLEQASSVTLGLNLDAQLRPESATILSINRERFNGKGTLLGRLLGSDRAAAEMLKRGLTTLYKAAEGPERAVTGPEHELYREMSRLLELVAGPVAEALARFTQVNSAGLSTLEPELAFYLGAARLITRMREAGFEFCRPQIVPVEERVCSITGLYNLELALRLWGQPRPGEHSAAPQPVPNDVRFGPGATIFILTGPNSGGKTTYTRAVGQAQALFQAGLPVPGRAAQISPVDNIFTHFAAAERAAHEATGGRLAEELERLAHIFGAATRSSLLLLNEPLASTDHASARILSRDIMAGLQMLGARTIFVTHIHELVEDSCPPASASEALPDTGIVSLVAGIVAASATGEGPYTVPTYTIRPGLPQALGYATELARQHGLSLDQISAVLRRRGMLGD